MLILLWLLLARLTLQGCSVGCQACNSINQCLFCDVTANYTLVGTSCALKPVDFCKTLAPTGQCLQCQPAYFPDRVAGRCVAVPPKFKIDFCQDYDSDFLCVQCAPGFVLGDAGCFLVDLPVANCQYYSPNSTCRQCSPGYLPSDDRLACLPLAKIRNCRVQSFVSCSQCARGFILDPNFYLQQIRNQTILQTTFVVSRYSDQSASQFVCAPVTDPYCRLATNNTVCLECADGFFPSNSRCVPIPRPTIQFCRNYASEVACAECAPGYYLKRPGLCEQATGVSNCLAYAGNATFPLCSECRLGFFLGANSTCLDRAVSKGVRNCEKWSLAADTCAACAASFQVTSDGLKCLPGVNYCQTYRYSDALSSTSTCLLCNPGFYLSSGSCRPSTVAQCLVSQVDGDKCVQCKNEFYLWNGLCIRHVAVPNCQNYTSGAANSCLQCAQGFMSRALVSVCVRRRVLVGCAVYTRDALACTSCQNGYFLTGGRCNVIPPALQFCSNYTSAGCQQCAQNYTLLGANCVPLPEHILSSCTNVDGSSPLVWGGASPNYPRCLTCAPNSLQVAPNPFDAVCVRTADLVFAPNFLPVTNCLRYGLSLSGYLVCMQCTAGLFLSQYVGPSTFSVVRCSTCDLLNNFVIPDDFFGSVNICMAVTAMPTFRGCGTVARTTAVNFANGGVVAADFACVNATANYVFQFVLSSSAEFLKDTLAPDTAAISDLGHGFTLYPSSAQPSVLNYRGVGGVPAASASVRLTDLCDIYWYPGLSGTRGALAVPTPTWTALASAVPYCLRCKFGAAQIVWLSSSTQSYPSCAAMPLGYCDGSVVAGGLPSFLNAAFSCHSCSRVASISTFPTLYMEFGQAGSGGSPADYNRWYQFPVPDANGMTGFSCETMRTVLVTGTQTMGGAGAAGPQTLTGCAAFGVLTPVSSTQTTQTPIQVCLACQSGSYPTYNPTSAANYLPTWAVTACSAIADCDPNSTLPVFNTCGRCFNDYSGATAVFRAFSDWSLTSCQRAATPFCLILLSPASSLILNNCTVCAAGYFLNPDGFCDTLSASNAAASFAPSYYYTQYRASLGLSVANAAGADKLFVRIFYLLQKDTVQYGSRRCGQGYTLSSPLVFNAPVCLQSFYLSSGYPLPVLTSFVPNCLAYNASATAFLCFQCKGSFIPTSDGKSCVSQISDCLFAQVPPFSARCATCKPSFLNSQGACSRPAISNCLRYRNDQSSATLPALLCSQCADAFCLSSDSRACLAGAIPNCRVYQQGNTSLCVTCADGFVPLDFNGTVRRCMPIDPASKCLQLARNVSNFDCTSCLQNEQGVWGVAPFLETLNGTSVPMSVCQQFGNVTGCVEYDQANSNASANSFLCRRCSTFLYLDSPNQQCLPRKNMSARCSKYHDRSDGCRVCAVNSYLDQASGLCVPNPTGMVQCTGYAAPNVCSKCRPPFYPFNGQCLPSATDIPFCEEFLADSVCRKCQKDYFLMSGLGCVAAVALNCREMRDPFTCSACPDGFGLVASNATVDCLSGGIENCNQTNATFPFSCLVCSPGYFPRADGNCSVQLSPIDNCLLYLNQTLCFQCQPQFVLSLDGRRCLADFLGWADPFCDRLLFANKSSCVECAFGFRFVDGACVQMTSDLANPGCLIPSPTDFKVCVICQAGYFQDQTGFCNYALPPSVQATTFVTAGVARGVHMLGALAVLTVRG